MKNVAQLHMVGYTRREGRWHDAHAEPIQRELLDLAGEVLRRAPVRGVIVERDENFPGSGELAAELRELEAIHAG